MKQLYKVVLTTAQRTELDQIVRKGKTNAHVYIHAHCLLKSAAHLNDQQIATELGISYRTVMRVRQRFCQGGLQFALYDKPKSGPPQRVKGEQKAAIVALTCTKPPAGHERWTLRLLADRIVELDIIEAISHTTVAEILKKTN